MQTTRHLDDPALSTRIGDLSIQDEDFRRWWASHQVTAAGSGVKTIRHSVAGDITLDWENFVSVADDEQSLSVMSAAPGTPAHDALAFLASWTAERSTASEVSDGAAQVRGPARRSCCRRVEGDAGRDDLRDLELASMRSRISGVRTTSAAGSWLSSSSLVRGPMIADVTPGRLTTKAMASSIIDRPALAAWRVGHVYVPRVA